MFLEWGGLGSSSKGGGESPRERGFNSALWGGRAHEKRRFLLKKNANAPEGNGTCSRPTCKGGAAGAGGKAVQKRRLSQGRPESHRGDVKGLALVDQGEKETDC